MLPLLSPLLRRGLGLGSLVVCSRSLHVSRPAMVLKVGDKIPSVDLFESTPANKVNLQQALAGKKAVVFAVPGAFTPGCSKTHLPGYVAKADELREKGVEEIVCISVNDPFVMDAWGREHKATGKIRMLADPAAAFTRAVELDTELAALGGTRSKRYSMVVENGVVRALNVEPDGTGLSCSLADKVDV